MRGAPKRNIPVNGRLLRVLRGSRGVTEVANKVGCSYAHLLNMEAGRRDGAPEHVDRLAAEYGVQPTDLYACPRAHRGCRCFAEVDTDADDAEDAA